MTSRSEIEAELATVEYGLTTISVFSKHWNELVRRRAELLIKLVQIDNPVWMCKEKIQTRSITNLERK